MTKGGFHISHTWGLIFDAVLVIAGVMALVVVALIGLSWPAHWLGMV